MRFSFYIAWRYLFSRKSTNVINVISGISVFGILFCTAALVILLSAFNGLESWVVRMYDAFDPDLKIEHISDHFFDETAFPVDRLREIKGVRQVMRVIEENGLLTYRDAQYICTIKGVSDEFLGMSGIDSMIIDGTFRLYNATNPSALVGHGVAWYLSLGLRDIEHPVDIYVPRPDASFTLNPAEAFHSAAVFPSGIFEIQPEFDTKYIIVPIAFAKDLFLRPESLSAVELQLDKKINVNDIKEEILRVAGPGFRVENRFEQHAVLYKIINSEKWGVFLIGTFILLIAVFNLTGSLTMLMVDKSKDIFTLQSLGAGAAGIRNIFFVEGLLITLIGLAAGLVTGLVVVAFQQAFGLVLINETEAYPMLVKQNDLLSICLTVLLIGAAAAWFPAVRLLKKQRGILTM